jgi:hypothetical protein
MKQEFDGGGLSALAINHRGARLRHEADTARTSNGPPEVCNGGPRKGEQTKVIACHFHATQQSCRGQEIEFWYITLEQSSGDVFSVMSKVQA